MIYVYWNPVAFYLLAWSTCLRIVLFNSTWNRYPRRVRIILTLKSACCKWKMSNVGVRLGSRTGRVNLEEENKPIEAVESGDDMALENWWKIQVDQFSSAKSLLFSTAPIICISIENCALVENIMGFPPRRNVQTDHANLKISRFGFDRSK